jgi:hypothetical protein
MKAEVLYDLDFEKYLEVKGASKGALCKMATSTPIECYNYMYKKEEGLEEKRHLAVGSLLHCLVLEPLKVDSMFLVQEKPDRRTKQGKLEYSTILATAKDQGKTWITPNEFMNASKIASAIHGHDLASTILGVDGDSEVTILWDSKGIPCRARFDFITKEIPGIGRFGVDLKTCRDLSRIARDHYDFGYDLQYIHYSRAATAAGIDLAGFIFIFVDSGELACSDLVRVIDPAISENYVELANARYKYAFDRFAECWHSNKWPGYSKVEFEAMQYTSWHEREIENLEG